jgi:amidohydrolase
MSERLTQWRRELHRMPELGLECYKTHDYVMEALRAMGYQPITMAKTGVIAFKEGDVLDTLAFRSDMDGLPIAETLTHDFVSEHTGRMHACGHDGHMSMLLGLADYCKDKHFHHSLLFVFQPAEEGPGGAKVLIEEGLFERFKVCAMFGLHLYPEVHQGQFSFLEGPMLAQTNEFDLIIEGKAAHGAQPHRGIDAIVLAAEAVSAIQAIVARRVNPLEPLVVTVGKLDAGEVRNIIAPKARLEGTIRCFNPAVFDTVQAELKGLAKSLELKSGAAVTLVFKGSYPPVINPKDLFERARSVVDEAKQTTIAPMMFAEDFSFYQEKVPAFFAMLGSRNETKDYVYPLHHDRFNFDESILADGLAYYVALIDAYENEKR